jgi:hypothetical protein
MKTTLRIVLIVMIGCTLTMNMGCASKVKTSGFLQDYPKFEKGPSGGADWVYFEEGVDFKKYDKVLMDQVVFYFSKDSKYKGINPEEINKLSDAFHKAMVKALKDEYPFVSEPGPGVLRIRCAITDVKKSRPLLNTITAVMPIGLAISFVKKGVTGTHTNVGGASMEAEFLNSQTNERIAAVITGQKGYENFWMRRMESNGVLVHPQKSCTSDYAKNTRVKRASEPLTLESSNPYLILL